MVRPSVRSTTRSSSVTRTARRVGSHLLDCWHSGGPTSPTIDIIPPQPILSFHVVLLAEAGDLLGDQPLRHLGDHFARHLPHGARPGGPGPAGAPPPRG